MNPPMVCQDILFRPKVKHPQNKDLHNPSLGQFVLKLVNFGPIVDAKVLCGCPQQIILHRLHRGCSASIFLTVRPS